MAFFRSLLISTNQTYLTFDAKLFKNHGAFLKHPWIYKYMRIRDVYSVENVHFHLRLCKHNLMQKTTLLQQSPTYITICCQCCLRSITHLAGKTLVLKDRYRKYLRWNIPFSRLRKGCKVIYIPQMTKKHIWPAPKISRQRLLLRYFSIEITAGWKLTTSNKKSIDPHP